MTNELSKNILCIQIRGGVEIWVEGDRAQTLIEILSNKNAQQFIAYEGRLINRADIVGVFTANDMEDATRRKNGQWQCQQGSWHEKKEECSCRSQAELDNREAYRQSYRATYGVDPL